METISFNFRCVGKNIGCQITPGGGIIAKPEKNGGSINLTPGSKKPFGSITLTPGTVPAGSVLLKPENDGKLEVENEAGNLSM